jgi:hypothetical protein
MITMEQEEELDRLIMENNPGHPNFNPSRSHQGHIMKLLFMKDLPEYTEEEILELNKINLWTALYPKSK